MVDAALPPDAGRVWTGLDRKLLVGTLILIVAFLPVVASAMYSLSAVIRSENKLSTRYTRTLILAQDLRNEKAQQNALVPVYVLTGEASILARLSKANDAFDQTLSKLATMPLAPDAKAIVASIGELQTTLRKAQQIGVEMRQKGGTIEEVDRYFRAQAVPYTRAINAALDALVDKMSNAYEQRKESDKQTFRNVFWVLLAASLLTVFFCVATGAVLARTIRQKQFQDTVKARLAERELEISMARKQAVETVAHDLKNPLSAISLMTELLQRQTDATSKSQTWLQGISSSVESMRLLIFNLLDHAKIEAGALTLDPSVTNVAALVSRLAGRFQIIAARESLTIADGVDPDLPLLMIDEARLEQVFSNLIGNAIKFTPAGGKVSLISRLDTDVLTIEVQDTGCGLSEDQVAHIFDRYWQAHETASKGTGLGLSIAKTIVEAHGGTLTVASQSGVGSTFRVSLPIRVPQQTDGETDRHLPQPKAA